MKTTPINSNTEIKKAVKFPLDTMDNDRVREDDVATKPIDMVFIGELHMSRSKAGPLFDMIESQLKDGKKVSCSMEYINADNSKLLKPNGLCELDVEDLKAEMEKIERIINSGHNAIVETLYFEPHNEDRLCVSLLHITIFQEVLRTNKELLKLKEKYGSQLTVQLLQVNVVYNLINSSSIKSQDTEHVSLRDHEMACELVKLMNSDKKIDSIFVSTGVAHIVFLESVIQEYKKITSKNINIESMDTTPHQQSSIKAEHFLFTNACQPIWEDVVKKHPNLSKFKKSYDEAVEFTLGTFDAKVDCFERNPEDPKNIKKVHTLCSKNLKKSDAEAVLQSSLYVNSNTRLAHEEVPKRIRSGSWTTYSLLSRQQTKQGHGVA